MIHKAKIFLLFGLIVISMLASAQHKPLMVNVIPKTIYFSPYPGDYVDDPYKFFDVIISNNTATSQEYYLVLKLETINPFGYSAATPINRPPMLPLSLAGFQSVTMTPPRWKEAFSHLNFSDIAMSGFNLNDFQTGNFLLPEGLYKACVIAYQHSSPGVPISEENVGCATFRICYNATVPQFITPMPDPMGGIQQVNQQNPMVFVWTPPIFNCAAPVFEYDVQIVELLDGQNAQTAIDFNPLVYRALSLRVTTLVLDTLMHPLTLLGGHTYVARVKARNTDPSRLIMIANDGNSPLCVFRYGLPPEVISVVPATDPPVVTDPPVIPPVIHDPTPTTIAECLAPAVTDKVAVNIDLNNKRIRIGYFFVQVQQASYVGESYTGNGFVHWQPYAGDTVRIKVEFNNIKVNSSLQVFEGEIFSAGDDMTNYLPRELQKAQDWATGQLNYFQQFGVNVSTYRQKMQEYANKLNETSRKINIIRGTAPMLLPLSIGSAVSSTPIDVGIVGMSFTPSSAKMNTMAVFEVPENDVTASPWMAFVGQGMCFTPDRLMFVDEGAMFLAADFDVKLASYNMVFKRATNLGDTLNGTFIKWDDNGFKQARIECDVLFPLTTLLAENTNGDVIPNQRVKASFATHFRSWSNWIATATMDPFQVKGAPGFGFLPQQIVFDNSSTVNPSGIKFPKNYPNTGANWKGFYLQTMALRLPPDFKNFGQATQRIEVGVSDLIIDNLGVSCELFAQNVINISTGNLGGWAFSLDTLQLKLDRSSLGQSRMAGKILLPVSETPLKYTGFITNTTNQLDYGFTVRPEADMLVPCWIAKMTINQNSGFVLKKDNAGIAINFLLNGKISMGDIVSNSAVKFGIKDVAFQNFGIGNRKPNTQIEEFYLDVGTWALASPDKTLGPFPFTFYKPELIQQGTKVGLKFASTFSLIEKFTLTTKLNVNGKFDWKKNISPPKISFDRVELDEISIDGDFTAVKVNGKLKFYYNDPTFGDGVNGQVSAIFKPGIRVDSKAQFGVKNNFTYWYVDAKASFVPGIEVFPLTISGFGGGVWYNMTSSVSTQTNSTQMLGSGSSNVANLPPNQSSSGIVYTPKNGHYGLKAGIGLGLSNAVGGPHVLNANAWIECGFTSNAVTNFRIHGNVFAITEFPDNSNALARGTMLMSYDFTKTELFFKINATALLKLGPLTASSVTVPMEFWSNIGQKKWYFKLGDAHDRNKRMRSTIINITTGPLKVKLTTEAYIAFGNALDNTALAPLPPEIVQFLQVDLSKYRTGPSTIGGPKKGMLFGARVDGSLDLNLIIYCHLTAIAGFDVAMYHDPNAKCNNKPVGYKGWYGNGQVYGYFDGDVGIKINVWFFKGSVSLAQLKAGALLIGGMPQPFWAYGKVKVKGSVLGGLIKISTSAELEVGEICYPAVGNPLADVRIIEEIKPGYQTLNEARQYEPESVFITPSVLANVALSTSAALRVLTLTQPPTSKGGSEIYTRYIFSVDTVWLRRGSGSSVNSSIPGMAMDFSVSNSNPNLVSTRLREDESIDPNRFYMIDVIASAKQWYANGGWLNPTIDGVRKRYVEQNNQSYFKTGPLPNYIPIENIEFTQPLNRQRFFRKDESFFIALNMARPDIFNNQDKRFEAWIEPVKNVTSSNRQKVTMSTGKRIVFYPVRSKIAKETVHRLVVIRIDKKKEDEFLQKLAAEKRRQVIKDLLLNSTVINTVPLNNIQGLAVAQPGQSQVGPNVQTVVGGSGINPAILGGGSSTTQPQGDPTVNLPSTQSIEDLWGQALKEHDIKYKRDTIDYRQMALEGRWNFDFVDTLFNITFRTSRFDNLTQKLNSFGALNSPIPGYSPDAGRSTFNASEPFDYVEMFGYTEFQARGLKAAGRAILPLLKFEESFDKNLYNDDWHWANWFFDHFHMVNDKCHIGSALKPRPNGGNVANPQGIKVDLGSKFRREITNFPLSNRQPRFYFPSKRPGFGRLAYPTASEVWFYGNYDGPVADPLSHYEIQTSPKVLANKKLEYNIKTVRNALHYDMLASYDFMTKFKQFANQFSSTNGSGRDGLSKKWVNNNTLIIGRSSVNEETSITMPLYQLVHMHSSHNVFYNNLRGVYPDTFPQRTYVSRLLEVYRIDDLDPRRYDPTRAGSIRIFY